ncbi:MAG TPA: hypothetical protein VFH51_16195, partial [Myxococcota bacterium]|nr:hypothetical protein [Myxococcota bacterium]
MKTLPPPPLNVALSVRPRGASLSAGRARRDSVLAPRVEGPRPQLAYAATLDGPLPPPPASAASQRPAMPRHHSDSVVLAVAAAEDTPPDPLAGWQVFALFAYSEDIVADGCAEALAQQLMRLTHAANGEGLKEFHLTRGDALVDATSHG